MSLYTKRARDLAPTTGLPIFVLIIFGTLFSWCFSSVEAVAASSNTFLGTNLFQIAYYSPEQPFIDLVKSGNHWITGTSSTWDTGEEASLCVDANGWPTTLTSKLTGNGTGTCTATPTFTQVTLLLNYTLPAPFYPSGNYDVYYSGSCTLQYRGDVTSVNGGAGPSGTGHDVLNIPTAGVAGIFVTITGSGSGANYCHNISVTQSTLTASWQSGAIFNPKFLQNIAPYNGIRFMQWECIDTNTTFTWSWSKRSVPSTVFYGGDGSTPSITCGVPVEVMVALCNQLNVNCLFNMPTEGSDSDFTSFASYVASNLNSGLKAYVEYSNETWNSVYTQTTWIQNAGLALWPGCGGGSNFECNRNYMGMRTAQMCQDWKNVYGSAFASRVVCVLGAQAANTYMATDSLSCALWTAGAPCSSSKYGISAIAIAPYFGYNVPDSWTTQSDGGLTSLFTEIMQGGLAPGGYPGGMIAQVINMVSAYVPVANSYGMALIAYEGGQSLIDLGDSALTALYIAANNDARMGAAYTTYLQGWKSATGGQEFFNFTDVAQASKYGSWGAVQSVMANSSAKYNALLRFVGLNPHSGAAKHDFNGDRFSDILWHNSTGLLDTWLMDGQQVLQSAGFGGPPTNWSVVGTGDFNGDGYADILWRDGAGDIAIWLMNGQQVLQTGVIGSVASSWTIVGTGDFNGDGKVDILWQNSNGELAIWLMNGLQISQSAGLGTVPSGWTIAGIGDFNDDGYADILWYNASTNQVAIWLMNGLQVLQSAGYGVPSGWTIAGTGDFNGDGTTDILWQNTNGTLAIWLMNGLQVSQSAGFASVPSGWTIAGTGDFNSDGMTDILWWNATTSMVGVWLMNGMQVTQATGFATVSAGWNVQSLNAN